MEIITVPYNESFFNEFKDIILSKTEIDKLILSIDNSKISREELIDKLILSIDNSKISREELIDKCYNIPCVFYVMDGFQVIFVSFNGMSGTYDLSHRFRILENGW